MVTGKHHCLYSILSLCLLPYNPPPHNRPHTAENHSIKKQIKQNKASSFATKTV